MQDLNKAKLGLQTNKIQDIIMYLLEMVTG
jgi:hypothetical protein